MPLPYIMNYRSENFWHTETSPLWERGVVVWSRPTCNTNNTA